MHAALSKEATTDGRALDGLQGPHGEDAAAQAAHPTSIAAQHEGEPDLQVVLGDQPQTAGRRRLVEHPPAH